MKIRIAENLSEQDIAEIHSHLKAYNNEKREPSTYIPLGLFLEEEGKKKAGLTGEVFGNWLCIKYLWVSEELRGQGIGSTLLKQAEQEAIRHGAVYSYVDTFDFQAPGFYEKHGYCEVFHLWEYPLTGKRCYYTKKLR